MLCAPSSTITPSATCTASLVPACTTMEPSRSTPASTAISTSSTKPASEATTSQPEPATAISV